MKKAITEAITKAVCVKSIATFAVISALCVIALGVFVKKMAEDLANQEELFIPGIIGLFAGVIVVLIFSVTRIAKNAGLIKEMQRIGRR